MKITGLLFACVLLGVTTMNATTTAATPPRAPYAIAVHGGSGTIEKGEFSPEKENQVRAALEQAVRAGHEILAAGGSSLDAVTRAVTMLEDSPHFNAGRGAVFNAEGKSVSRAWRA